MATDVAGEQQHYPLEEPNLPWLVEKEEDAGEEERDKAALEYQQGFSTGGVLPSSSSTSASSPASMKEIDWNGGGLQLTTDLLDAHPAQKQEEVSDDDNGRDKAAQHGTEPEDTKFPSEAAGTNGDISTTSSTSHHKNSVYFDDEHGIKTNNAVSDIRNGVSSMLEYYGESGAKVESSELQKLLSNEVNHHCAKPSKDDGPVGPELSPTANVYESNNKGVRKSSVVTREEADLNAIEAIKSELTELDVEAVLEKQETHDLFCPNCNSCITKRVILRKRKRLVRDLDSKGNRDKPEAAVSSEFVNVEASANPGDGPIVAPVVDSSRPATGSFIAQSEPTSVSDEPEGPEVFRCLSCFSFLIPTAGNLFRRGTSEPDDPRSAQKDSATIAIWSLPIVTTSTRAKASQGGDAPLVRSKLDTATKNESSSNMGMSFYSGIDHKVPIAVTSVNKNGYAESQKFGKPKLEGIATVPSISDSSKAVHQTQTSSNMASLGKFSLDKEALEFSSAPYHAADLEVNGVKIADKIPYTTKNESSSNNGMSFYPGIGHEVPIAVTSINKNGDAESKMFGTPKLEGITIVPSISNSSKAVHQTQTDSRSNIASVGKLSLDKNAHEFSSAPSLAIVEVTGVQIRDKISYTTAEGYMPGNVMTDGKMEVEDVQNKINKGDAGRQAQQGGSDFRQSSIMELDESISSTNQKTQLGGSYIAEFSPIGSPASEKLKNGMESVQSASAISGEIQVSNGVSDLQSIDMDSSVSTADQITVVHKVNISPGEKINTDIELNKSGGDVIVTVESSSSQGANNYIISETATLEASSTQVHILGERNAEAGENYKLEILKSIVYGGLIESITSLGIVSSAVGGGAAALNIVALGLASLVGGLIVMVDNLLELKSHPSFEDHQQVTSQDRYQELLGRRANFGVHITVTILSFLIFGSVPLAMYGFLDCKNYKTLNTIASVLAASLLCIILLSGARVYTKKPPKSYIKTVSYYVTMAVAASGISYVAGDLVRDMLEKFSHPQTGLNVITGLLDDTGNVKPTLSSY